jgi:ATP-dependent RNA helicase DHX33
MPRFGFNNKPFNNKLNSSQKRPYSQVVSNQNGHVPPDKRNGWQIRVTPKKQPQSRTDAWDEIQRQRQGLPITGIRDKIVSIIKQQSTIIFIGETASGKTTQIPQFIHEAGICSSKMIAVTQPRRVAAVSIATRVSAEMGSDLGQTVGYSVRFDERVSNATKIKYMTDGMLLREAISDPLLQQYNVVLLDEAHERSIQTDVLFGILKRCQSLRSEDKSLQPLQLIIMSATMDVDHFSKYFNDAPVFYLEGRQHPISIHFAVKEQEDYIHSAIATVLQIHREHESGDILVFCTGQEEISSMVTAIRSAQSQIPAGITTSYTAPMPKLFPLPLHASLPPADQLKVFRPAYAGSRKVVFATNVAETSLTIPGIRFVVDTCRLKARTFDPVRGFESLKIERISKAQAEQRAGRAGRDGPGIAYRLLTEEQFSELSDFSVPEILRVSLSNVILQLVAMGITDVMSFDFMYRPKLTNFESALDELKMLQAIQEDDQVKDLFRLTSLGQEMISFPLEPKYAKILVASKEFGCTEEILTIIAMLYVDTIFYIHPNYREKAADAMKKFTSSEGDLIRLLNVYKSGCAGKFSPDWCKDNFVHIRNMELVREVRKQLAKIWFNGKNKNSSCAGRTEQVRRCLLSGLKQNAAILHRDGIHRTIEKNEEVFIHPSSCLFHTKPEAVIFTELVETSKRYIRNISVISIDWIEAPGSGTGGGGGDIASASTSNPNT